MTVCLTFSIPPFRFEDAKHSLAGSHAAHLALPQTQVRQGGAGAQKNLARAPRTRWGEEDDACVARTSAFHSRPAAGCDAATLVAGRLAQASPQSSETYG